MRVSYQWLAEYFDQPPSPAEMMEALELHAFEVEEIEEQGGDTTFEVKVLPDRAGDCLSHWGIAKEVAAILNLPLKELEPWAIPAAFNSDLKIKIADEQLCRRYLGRMVKGVKVAPSPEWLVKSLASVGQRSINNVVDATNFVLLNYGQPLHAFDAEKVRGGIMVRPARAGEAITTLDERDLELDESMLVIADDEGPLALAGLKGGRRAEVTAETSNIILESANFDPANIRQTSARLNLRTDASKRFENNPSPVLAELGMRAVSELLVKLNPNAELGEVVDEYSTSEEEAKQITFPIVDFAKVIGVELDQAEIKNYLERLGLVVATAGDEITVTIPLFRRDLEIKENIIEEVARLYGYNKLPTSLPAAQQPAGNPEIFDLTQVLKQKLVDFGATEVYGYTFTAAGERELENPLAGGREWLRINLTDGLAKMLADNAERALFDDEPVMMFEIGTVFGKQVEQINLALGVAYKGSLPAGRQGKESKAKTKLDELWQMLGEQIEAKSAPQYLAEGRVAVLEIALANLTVKGELETNLGDLIKREVKYQPYSVYPRVIRDVALWVSDDVEPAKIAEIIRQNAGDLLAEVPVLFDEFSKDGRTSYAFRLVFQSSERTLTDEEVNQAMGPILSAFTTQGWELR